MRTDTSNPYVGLRPFEIDESILFFGRNEQIMELLQQLHHYHFVAVVGSSGCGKSSLLRAGVIPALKAGYLLHDSDQWHIAIMRPGQNPLYNLVSELLNWGSDATDSAKVSKLLNEMETNGVQPLLDLLIELKQKENKNFFLLIDQFEELFRFTIEQKNKVRKDEANDFVNMMLELSRQHSVPFYVVMTMRSDFMGDCTKFYGLPEAMNKSLFLVPKLNRVQMKMAIEGPARLYGGKLNAALVSRLLNEVGKFDDELPILQHALMRIWNYEMNIDKSGELDMGDYDAIGGMQEALSKHADEALAKMDKPEFMVAKEIFQALTMIDEHGRKTRRPVLLSELVELTGAMEAQLLKIIQRFIEGKRSFLIVNDVADTHDKVIDISHESLIREWQRLNRWMDEEAESAALYLRLAEAYDLHHKGKKDFLVGSELQLTLDWKNKFKPAAVWANRYREGFDEAISYLEASEKNQTAKLKIEQERQENERRSKKRLSTMFKVIGALTLLAIIAGLATLNYKKDSEKNAKLAATQEEMLKLKDSVLNIANEELGEAKLQLETLKTAQDSIQNIIAQGSTDNSTKTRLASVSYSLNTAIKQSEEDIRKKDLGVKVKTYGGNKDVIYKTILSLTKKVTGNISEDELYDDLYFLNNSKKVAWTTAMIKEGNVMIETVMKAMEVSESKFKPSTIEQVKRFRTYLSQIESYAKKSYSKKSTY